MFNRVRGLIADRSGNFALMFALSAVPIITAMGAAVDYSYALTAKTQLQQAADSAAVGALAEQSVGVIAALKNGTSGEITVGEKDAEAIFKANMDPKLASYVSSYNISVQRNGSQFTSQVKFTANVPTSFLGIIGKNSIQVSGTAQGSYVPATYVDFYLMLDNSPSMGLGATTADISKLEANTSDTCAFACHIDNSTTDYYSLAKKLGITTRIQLVSQAAQAMMSTAKSTRKYSDQYRMAVYSMGANATSAQLTNIASMSYNLDDVASKTSTIDLMSIPYQNYNSDQMTDLLTNLTSLKSTMGTGGSGLNATDRQKVLFLVSDGVEDANRPSGCLKKLSGTTRCQQPIDYSICTKIKSAGIRIAVLYTTYQPLPNNSWYNTWIAPFSTEINPDMKACASTDLFFEVSPSDGITEAMNALFLKVVNLPRLTG
jgi:Flp pilus assembly protein TadG